MFSPNNCLKCWFPRQFVWLVFTVAPIPSPLVVLPRFVVLALQWPSPVSGATDYLAWRPRKWETNSQDISWLVLLLNNWEINIHWPGTNLRVPLSYQQPGEESGLESLWSMNHMLEATKCCQEDQGYHRHHQRHTACWVTTRVTMRTARRPLTTESRGWWQWHGSTFLITNKASRPSPLRYAEPEPISKFKLVCQCDPSLSLV